MIEKRAANIRLLMLDVDGVLTDGRITMNHRGEEAKSFDVKDGQGLKMLMAEGLEVALVTGRSSEVVSLRADDLGIMEVHQGVKDKRSLCQQLAERKGLERNQICCVADDLPDLGMFEVAGLKIAVADAVAEIRDASDLVTHNTGGRGAVREVCELILKAQGRWRPEGVSGAGA